MRIMTNPTLSIEDSLSLQMAEKSLTELSPENCRGLLVQLIQQSMYMKNLRGYIIGFHFQNGNGMKELERILAAAEKRTSDPTIYEKLSISNPEWIPIDITLSMEQEFTLRCFKTAIFGGDDNPEMPLDECKKYIMEVLTLSIVNRNIFTDLLQNPSL